MGFFSFTKEVSMDLGTANTVIISDGHIVVDQPSVVAMDRHSVPCWPWAKWPR